MQNQFSSGGQIRHKQIQSKVLCLFTSLRRSWLLLVMFFCVYADITSEFSKAESLYQHAQYQQAIERINSILTNEKNIAETLLVKLYTYQAFSFVALNNRDEALNSLRYLLIVNPNLQFDPKYVSPKIIEIFEESKRIRRDSLKVKSAFIPTESGLSHYRQDMHKQRAMRSLLYPGLGQIYDNRKKAGYIFMGTETVSIIGLVASHFLTNAAHKKYKDNQDLDKMDELYNRYAFWYQIRIGFCISSVGIWILNYINTTLAD